VITVIKNFTLVEWLHIPAGGLIGAFASLVPKRYHIHPVSNRLFFFTFVSTGVITGYLRAYIHTNYYLMGRIPPKGWKEESDEKKPDVEQIESTTATRELK